MSMQDSCYVPERGTAGRGLAEAMRAGLEARKQIVTPVSSVHPKLRRRAALADQPAVAAPGPLRFLIQFARRVVRAFSRPWLEFQTAFNRAVIEELDSTRTIFNSRLAEFDRRLLELSRSIDEQCDAAVNREQCSAGKIAQAGLWFNPPVWVQIQDNRPRVVAISERIVEHIFVHTRLPPLPARVLDVGCSESTSPLEMASLGYEVVGIDLRDLSLRHPLFQMVCGDVGNMPFPDGSFDVVVSLSTLEHVGLGWYAETPRGTTDQKAAAEIWRVLRPGGRFILTIPFGRPAVTPLHRIYDRPALDALLSPFRRVETSFAVRQGDAWCFTTEASTAEQAESAERVSAVALVVAEKA
jgi:SAM-dependent methyltransferase